MDAVTEQKLAAELAAIVDHIQHLRQLDLSAEAGLKQALAESQDTLGALAMYRVRLSRIAGSGGWQRRHAA